MQDARLAGRLQKELKMLQDPPPGVCVWPADERHLSRLEAQIQGPDGSVYSKGIFKLEVDIPDRYPFEPPNVKFITPVYHPNIDSGGRICHDILNMPPKGQWKPSLNIGAVLSSIRVLLEEPNHEDGLMSDISAEYKHNRSLFDAKARQSTERHAMQNPALRDTASCCDKDHATSVELQTTNSKHEATIFKLLNNETVANTLARPVLIGVDSVGPSKVTLDEPSTSASGESSLVRPRQNFAAKLSLAKACAAQGPRSLGAAGELEVRGTLSFSSETLGAHQTEMCLDPNSQSILQPETIKTSIASAGKETIHPPEDDAAVSAAVESDRARLNIQAVQVSERKDLACCSITTYKETKPETFASQSSQKTTMGDAGKRLKLKLSRPSATQSIQESAPIAKTQQGLSHVRKLPKALKEPVIILDSESDDEDNKLQARSLGAKRKRG